MNGLDFTNINLITPKFKFLFYHNQPYENQFMEYIYNFYNANLR